MHRGTPSTGTSTPYRTRFWLWAMAGYVGIAVALGGMFIYIDAFEAFYDYTRAHEDWNLDEVAVAVVGALMSAAFVGMVVVTLIAKRLLKAEALRRDSERQLAQSRNLIALGTMVAGTAHSINNHLMPIIALADLVQSELPAQSQQGQDLAKVVAAARSAAEIVARMKTFAKTNHTVKGQCEIAAVTHLALDLARRVSPSSAQFVLDVGAFPHQVAVSAAAWEIVVLNLVGNAVDALHAAPGTIQVSLRLVDASQTTQPLSAAGAKTWVEFQVKDSGEGMSEDVKRRIFDPFFTTKPAGKGTGLGLPETFGIVDSAGGTMEVTSAVGQGTQMTVCLPVVG